MLLPSTSFLSSLTIFFFRQLLHFHFDIPSSFEIVHEKLEKQEKKQEIQEEEPEVEEQEKALEKKLTGKADKKDVSDQIAVFAVDINKKKEEFMPTKSKKRNKGWSVTEAFS